MKPIEFAKRAQDPGTGARTTARNSPPLRAVLPLLLALLPSSAARADGAPTLRWLGGPTALIEAGDLRVLLDPVLGEGDHAFVIEVDPNTGEKNAPIRRHSPLPPVDLRDIDLVLVSHLHQDHFDRTARKSLPKEVRVILPSSQTKPLEAEGFTRVGGIAPGEEAAHSDGGTHLSIVALPARHSLDPQVEGFLGDGNGYRLVLRMPGRKPYSILWTGDTLFFGGFHEFRERYGRPDLLLIHLGGVGAHGPLGLISMNAVQAVRVSEILDPRTTVPIHHSTFSLYREPIGIFGSIFAASRAKGRLRILHEGETLRLRK